MVWERADGLYNHAVEVCCVYTHHYVERNTNTLSSCSKHHHQQQHQQQQMSPARHCIYTDQSFIPALRLPPFFCSPLSTAGTDTPCAIATNRSCQEPGPTKLPLSIAELLHSMFVNHPRFTLLFAYERPSIIVFASLNFTSVYTN